MNAPSRTRSGASCHLTRHGTAAPVGPLPARPERDTEEEMKMFVKKGLLAEVAGMKLAGTHAAMAVDRDHDGRPDRSWAERHDHDGYRDAQHDRYWRPGFGRFV